MHSIYLNEIKQKYDLQQQVGVGETTICKFFTGVCGRNGFENSSNLALFGETFFVGL
jgi:hypothetical protein